MPLMNSEPIRPVIAAATTGEKNGAGKNAALAGKIQNEEVER